MFDSYAQPCTIKVAAVVLAGGQGSRMGYKDKGLVLYDGRPMIDWTLEYVAPLVEKVVISCNRNFDQYSAYGYSLVIDQIEGYQGPLAGIHAAMKQLHGYTHLLVLPCDTPLLNRAVIDLLLGSIEDHVEGIVLLKTGVQPQFLHAVIPIQLCDDLSLWLSTGERAVFKWYQEYPMHFVHAELCGDALKNINSEQDLR